MPTYCYVCNKCGGKGSEIRDIRKRNKITPCGCGGHKTRDLTAEQVKSGSMDYAQPVLSDAMGVNPDQVAEHRRVHPTVPILDDGRVVVKNHAEGKRIRKELGMFDRDGYTR